MARSASKGIFPRTGIVDGHIITHPNGKRYQWNSSKGVWKLKSTMIDDSNFIGPQGIQGPPGPAGAAGATGSTDNNSTVAWGQLEGHSTYNDFNTEPANWGWTYIQGSINAPNTDSAQWYRQRVSLGSQYGKGTDANSYWLEIAYPRYGLPHKQYQRTCEAGNIGEWFQTGKSNFSATGGTLTTSAGYKYHTFTSSGTFTVIGSGTVDYLIVAGGGNGGSSTGGGGGAGGVLHNTITAEAGAYNVIIGAGGLAGYKALNNGGNSSAFSQVALGGGHGALTEGDGTYYAPGTGGSGGGGTVYNYGANGSYGTGTVGQGYNGGSTNHGSYCGGGGGAGAAGDSNQAAGNGGVGYQWVDDIWYGGGGASGSSHGNSIGGVGGGGNFASDAQNGTGGGGGGHWGHSGNNGGSGGSGIIIVRYLA